MSRLLLLMACSSSLMGCILRDFNYDPPANLPPSVHGSADSPMNAPKVVNLDELTSGGGDAGTGGEISYKAIVRDGNFRDELEALVYIDRNPAAGSPPISNLIPIPAEQDEDPGSRQVEFKVTGTQIGSPGCHVVELFVSRGFTTFLGTPQPEFTGDVGSGAWFIAAFNAASPDVDMTACPRF